MTTKPETYWERRCVINENVMFAMFMQLKPTLPDNVIFNTSEILHAYDEAINRLTKEFEDGENTGR